jgi:hypothetical protein
MTIQLSVFGWVSGILVFLLDEGLYTASELFSLFSATESLILVAFLPGPFLEEGVSPALLWTDDLLIFLDCLAIPLLAETGSAYPPFLFSMSLTGSLVILL